MPRRLLIGQSPDIWHLYEIQWALCIGQLLSGNTQIAHCGYYRGMPHQRLDGPEVHACFKKMGRKTMPERMYAAFLFYSGPLLCAVIYPLGRAYVHLPDRMCPLEKP